MNALQHMTKLLKKHNARLMIEHRNEESEMVLSIPARRELDGTIAQYAVEFRLGAQFPQSSEAERKA